MTQVKQKLGFTLVELLIYVALISVVLSLVLSIIIQLNTARVRSANYNNGINNLRYVLNRISKEIQNAELIVELTDTSLTLASSDPLKNPILISWIDNQVYLGYGVSGSCTAMSPCQLSDDSVRVVDWNLINKSGAVSQSVQLEMVVATQTKGGNWDQIESYIISSTLRSQ